VRSHAKTEADAKKNAATLTLKDAAKNIRCPLYIVAGRQDRLIPPEHAERLAKAASGPVELLMVEDGGHNANNRPYRYRSQSADWMAERLGVPKR
jgi:2,6-dihydroxypseudooxynicotine hydrolase